MIEPTQDRTTVIGTFYSPPRSLSTIAGFDSAADGFFRALIRDDSIEPHFFVDPASMSLAESLLQQFVLRPLKKTKPLHIYPQHLLAQRFVKASIDAWHDFYGEPFQAFHARATLFKRIFPITSTHHTISYQQMTHSWYLPLLLSDVLPCDSIVCTSTAVKRAIENVLSHLSEQLQPRLGNRLSFGGRFDVIPLGVDTSLFRPRERGDARHQFSISTDALVFLWIGRFSSHDKADLMPLLLTFARLVETNPDKQLLLVMAGTRTQEKSYIDTLAKMASECGLADRVLLILDLPRGQQHLLYSAADVFVSPVDNVQESIGITPIEALACGVPQVVADWDGYRDTVMEGVTGFRVPTLWANCLDDISLMSPITRWETTHYSLAQSVAVDPACLQRALQQLIDSEGLRRNMAENSRRRAVALYDWKQILARYTELWAELSVVARALPTDRVLNGSLHFPYFEAFSGYASRVLDGGTRLRLTPAGRKAITGRRLIDGLDDPENVSGLRRLLTAFATAPASSIENVASQTVPEDPLMKNLVWRSVLWLLKYGLVDEIPLGAQDELAPPGGGDISAR